MLDTGNQKSLLVHKQTSTESDYNIFDEIIWKTGSQCLGTGMTSFTMCHIAMFVQL
ncbi:MULTISPECIES: hypothetical protein [Wolbachia]|uniref:hypothetical protein n=1 Tax=Wolbachia TaxID=953 RepID=UPI001650F9F6|nr:MULTISPECIES: hypothetical protein [Wolbachia]MBC6686331.1 hypothetical protein [Wolbachia pipientis]